MFSVFSEHKVPVLQIPGRRGESFKIVALRRLSRSGRLGRILQTPSSKPQRILKCQASSLNSATSLPQSRSRNIQPVNSIRRGLRSLSVDVSLRLGTWSLELPCPGCLSTHRVIWHPCLPDSQPNRMPRSLELNRVENPVRVFGLRCEPVGRCKRVVRVAL